MASPTMPMRSRTNDDDDALAGAEDTSETTRLFNQRLQAWKHACGYLEDYVTAHEKMYNSLAKDYEKSVLKTVNSPLKEGEQFSHEMGGMAEMFDKIRANTQSISNSHHETARGMKSTVLPIFERLHNEIKTKQKELAKGAGKSNKNLDKARDATQKHVELLGKHTSTMGSPAAKTDASTDPYVLQRGIYHRLNKQLHEEKASRSDTLAVQENFSRFESHVVQTLQQGMTAFMTATGGGFDQQKGLYTDMVVNSQRADPMFEWNGFVHRNSNVLIDPSAPPRTLNSVSFANQNHAATQPLCQGSLERKAGLLKKWDSSFWVITPAKYMHEYKTEDDLAKDPTPDTSLYLPDCTTGGLNANLFSVKGKDTSGSKLSISTNKEYEFRTATDKDAETWWNVIRQASGAGELVSPTSPVGGSRNVSGAYGTQGTQPETLGETGPVGTTTNTPTTGTTTSPTTSSQAPQITSAIPATSPMESHATSSTPITGGVPASSASAAAQQYHHG